MISQTSLLSLLSFILPSKCCRIDSGPHLSSQKLEEGLTGIKRQKPRKMVYSAADFVSQIVLVPINIFVNIYPIIVKLILKQFLQ